MNHKMARVGDDVRVSAGFCGEGYRFVVTQRIETERGAQLYGANYGPVRESEVDVLTRRPLSQHCRAIGDHAHCPRETTLGTKPCECPCHD